MADLVDLRPWASEDLPLLERLMGDPAMTEHLGGPEDPEKIRARNERYAAIGESGQGRMFVITVDGEPAGSIGYWERETEGGLVWETGWSVLPEFQGQSVATRATQQAIARARGEDKHRWLHAYPSTENGASNAICRKLGFEWLSEDAFEYPPGNPVVCNDWRFDLFSEDQGK